MLASVSSREREREEEETKWRIIVELFGL